MKTTSGFTLMEIMIVMAILAILMAVGAGAFTSSMRKGRDSTRKANLRSITTALDMYYSDKGKYPVGVNGEIRGCGSDAAPTLCTDGVFKDVNNTLYMAKIPSDPISSLKYYYVSASGVQYQIYAHLENGQDPMLISTTYNCDNAGGTMLCNWGLSSGNTNP
jgi:type II secretion system protein G